MEPAEPAAPGGKTVRFVPGLRGGRLERRSMTAPPFPFDHERLLYTFSGTAAIYQAAATLALPRGSVALCPSYNCGHEIEPLIRRGLRPEFYDVDLDMGIDVDDLERRLHGGVKLVLVIHYFGFPQRLARIADLCREREIFLIEDCAHALYSASATGPLGTRGDLAVFSLRKSLPIPNGGALVSNNPALTLPGVLREAPVVSTWSKVLELRRKALLEGIEATRRPAALAGLLAVLPAQVLLNLVRLTGWPSRTEWFDPDDEWLGFDTRILGWGMAGLSHRIIANTDHARVVAARRANCARLMTRLAGVPGVHPVFRELPERVCPLFLPVRVEGRERLFQELAKERVHTGSWWQELHPAVPWEEFPRPVRLKREVLALPVHQDLRGMQIDRMVEALERLTSDRSRQVPRVHRFRDASESSRRDRAL